MHASSYYKEEVPGTTNKPHLDFLIRERVRKCELLRLVDVVPLSMCPSQEHIKFTVKLFMKIVATRFRDSREKRNRKRLEYFEREKQKEKPPGLQFQPQAERSSELASRTLQYVSSSCNKAKIQIVRFLTSNCSNGVPQIFRSLTISLFSLLQFEAIAASRQSKRKYKVHVF